MKYIILFSLVLLTASCGNSQPDTDPAINIPVDDPVQNAFVPDLTAGIDLADQNVCRTNMQVAASAIAIYQAQYGELPATLEETSSGSVVCPHGGRFLYAVEGQSWTVTCPADIPHGSITDGACDW